MIQRDWINDAARPPSIGRCPACDMPVNILHYEWFEEHYNEQTKDDQKRLAQILFSYRRENPLEEC